jgi:hypothetical protein
LQEIFLINSIYCINIFYYIHFAMNMFSSKTYT